MNRVTMRQIALWVALTALLVPHWCPPLRGAGESPLSFVAGALIALVLVTWRGLSVGRR